MAEGSLVNRIKKGRPFQNQHAPLCPACGQVCSKYIKRNHFPRCCPPDVRSKGHIIDEQSSDVEYELYEDSVLTVYTDESIRHVSTGPLFTEMMLPNKTAIKLQIDSGSTVNVISAKHVDINNVTILALI